MGNYLHGRRKLYLFSSTIKRTRYQMVHEKYLSSLQVKLKKVRDFAPKFSEAKSGDQI